MADQIPLQLYKYNDGTSYQILPSYNVSNQLHQVNYADVANDPLFQRVLPGLLQDASNLTGQKYTSIEQALGGSSGYITDAQGNFTTQKAVDEQAANEAAAAAGTMTKVPVGSGFGYIPTGSAADKLTTGLQNGTVSPTDPNQQFAASMTGNNVNAPGIVPQAPNQPIQAQTQGVQTAQLPQGQQQNTQQGQGLQMPTFYKPDPNSPQVFNAQGQPLSYEQYIAQGGKQDFSNVVNGPIPNQGGTGGGSAGSSIGLPENLTVTTIDDVIKKIASAFGMDEVNKQMADLDEKFIQDAADINDDPWLIEGVREKRLKQLQDKYDAKKNALVDRLKLQQDVVGKAIDVYYKEKDLQMEGLKLEMDAKKDALDNQLSMLTPDYKNYLLSAQQGYTGSFEQWQTEDANRKAKASGSGLGGMFSAAQISNTVNSIANNFDNEQIVKDYNQILNNVNFVKNAGKTPTDDIGRVYAFAKVMDPNSVVREGEYKTVQDYSTALLQQFGLRAKRIFTNTGFLTDEARGFMLNTLNNKLTQQQASYDNLYNQYQQRINNALQGKGNTLPDYRQTTPSGASNLPPLSSFNFQLGQ